MKENYLTMQKSRREFLKGAALVVGLAAGLVTIVEFLQRVFSGNNYVSNNPNTQSSSNSTQQPVATQEGSSTSTPTEVPLQVGQFPYNADWSKGPDNWEISGPWKLLDGQLVNDGTGDGFILAPFNPPSPNYAIDMDVYLPQGSQVIGPVARVIQTSQGTEGYIGRVNCEGTGYSGIFNMLTENGDLGNYQVADFSVWHHIRFELKDANYKLIIDGQSTDGYNEAQDLSAGQVGIYSMGYDQGIAYIKNFSVSQV